MKKILAVFLSAALMASAVPSTAASYSDTKGHWAEKQIDSFTELGLVSGHDGAFRPDASITRGELAVILDQIMDYQVAAENSFTDLDQNFYTEAILKANAAGVMVGDGGRVRPNDPITRQEAAVMIAQALRLEDGGSLDGFTDQDQVATWAAKSVAALAGRGYVSGSDGQFKPNSPITRAEVVTILNQAVQKLVSAGETATGTVSGNVVVRGGDVTLTDLTVEDDLILADGIGQGDVTMENVTVNGRIIVRGGGEHSILMNNVRVGGGVVVNKLDGWVRIVTSGSTNVTLTVLESGAILVGDGFETVEISAEMAAGQVVELDGTFTALINHSASVTIQADGKINSVTASVPTAITGDDVDIGKITSGSSDVTLNDKVLPSTGTSSSGGGGGGGGSSSGDDDDEEPETPDPVYSITLDTDVLTLKVGETQTLTADVTVPEGQDDTVAWVSSDDTVASVSDTGLVTALAEGSASITASILNNAYSVSCDVTVTLAEPEPEPEPGDPDPGWNESTDTDARFAEGYPICATTDTGKVSMRVKLDVASAEAPVEVYMVVNQINSGSGVDSTAVIHGHAGVEDSMIWVDEVAYLKLIDTQEYVVETDVIVNGNQDIDVYFVLKDQAGGISETPTTVVYGKELAAEVDQIPPRAMSAYINEARDAIYIHYDDDLDTGSVPSADAFTLSGLDGAALTGSVTLEQAEDVSSYYTDMWYFKLGVTGIDQDADLSGLEISYTPPQDNPIQDNATVPNQAGAFTERVVSAQVTLPAENIYVSADGRYIYFVTANSEYFPKDVGGFNITLTNSDGETIEWKENGQSWRNDGGGLETWLERTGGAEVGADGQVVVTLTPEDGTVNYAMDAITQPIAGMGTTADSELKIVSAVYDADAKQLAINLEGDLGNSTVYACNFQLKDPDGNLYTLRGFLQNQWEGNGFLANEENLFVTPEEGWTLVYSVKHADARSHEIVVGMTGEPLADTEIEITIP